MSHDNQGPEITHISNQEDEDYTDSNVTPPSNTTPYPESTSRLPGGAPADGTANGDVSPTRGPPSPGGSGRYVARSGRPRPHRRRREPEGPPLVPPPPPFTAAASNSDLASVRGCPENPRISPTASSDPEATTRAEPAEHVGPVGLPSKMQPVPGESQDKSDPVVGPAGSESPDCAICLQACVHPTQLPCLHVFCFLCAKGAIKNSKRCAMCRSEVPADYLDNPHLLNTAQLDREMALSDGYQWFYEGRNGWWQYDERTAADLEAAFTAGEKRAELLVAGYQYVVDLEAMLQLRRTDPARRRRVKRDLATAAKKGVAGLRGTRPAQTGAELEAQMQTLTVGQPRDDEEYDGDGAEEVL